MLQFYRVQPRISNWIVIFRDFDGILNDSLVVETTNPFDRYMPVKMGSSSPIFGVEINKKIETITQ